jgi:hypothetical protein
MKPKNIDSVTRETPSVLLQNIEGLKSLFPEAFISVCTR